MLEFIPSKQVPQRISEGWQIVSRNRGDYAALMHAPKGWEPVWRNTGDMAVHYLPLGSIKVQRIKRGLYTTCTMPGCDGRHQALGYCQKHYRRFKTTGSPQFVCKPGPKAHGECDFPKCRRKSVAKGLCNRHYLRYRAADRKLAEARA